jgi:hypothetical protein
MTIEESIIAGASKQKKRGIGKVVVCKNIAQKK